MANNRENDISVDLKKYDFKDPEKYIYKISKGLNRNVVEEISKQKNEPKWMLDIRLKALDVFFQKPTPTWGGDLSLLDYDSYTYYIKPSDRKSESWDDIPENIKKTFDRLGVPEAERKFLAGLGAQYESEMVYHSIREDLAKKGVIFLDTETGLKEYPELFRDYFTKLVPIEDNKFAALNTACWSGGSFIYVPIGVESINPHGAV